MSVVALIPARGGSKRIPHKNIRPFLGKPIIAYTIEAAQQAGIFDQIIVSTDDQAIAAVATQYGAETLMRPPELADDYCVLIDVVRHAIDSLTQNNNRPDRLFCFYATAPMIDTQSIHQANQMVDSGEADLAMTVTSFPFPVQRALLLDEQQAISSMYPEYANTRSQDLPEAFHDAAHFFMGKTDAFYEGGVNKAIVVPRYRVQDIDTEEDWLVAEQQYVSFQQLNTVRNNA